MALTVTVQLLLVATVPPVNEMVPDPAVAVAVPPQVLLKPFGVETTRPAGRLSVNVTPFDAAGLLAGLVIVIVNVEVPFTAIAVGLNAFAIDGGTTTLSDADAVPPVPPSVDVTFPVVLFCAPSATPVTFTPNVQEVEAARLALDKLIVPVAAVAVIVPPPHEPLRPFGVETTKPAGNVSVNATPLNAVVVLLF